MRQALRRLRERIVALLRGERVKLDRRVAFALKLVAVLPVVFLVLFILFVSLSNQPRFCVTCHYMQPFYDAWKTSSHNNVKCVDCHIPPGARNWLEHKMAAANQVVRYVTRQYGTRPWVEIDDSACLRSGCHETRLLAGKVQFGGVSFDHAPHLTSFRRVTRLRCTSCHAQIVQGTHMTVTSATCFICHFKNTEEEPDLARCSRCHDEIKPHRRTDVPAEAWVKQQPDLELETKTPSYDHEEVTQRQVDCRYCHSDMVQGQGDVPPDRCILCHTDPSRLERYNDIEFMHLNHVTEHKVDCLRCHLEIQHKLPEREKIPELDCGSCHPGQHAETRELYRGEGGSVPGPANPMFDVRVPCEGCHLHHEPVDGQRITTHATAAGCMLCHGEQYGQALAEWQTAAVSWTDWAQQALAASERALAGQNQTGLSAARGRLASARNNLQLVLRGHFIHNPDYAISLLRKARDQANAALAEVGSDYRWPPEPKTGGKPAKPAEEACLRCHANAVERTGFAFGSTFSHRIHVGSAQLACTTCHSGDTRPTASTHGRLIIGRETCRQCHEKLRPESPHPDGWRILHGGEARLDDSSCATCHSQPFCDGCHGTRIPHPDDWIRRHGRADTSACVTCHQTSFCNACHRNAAPTDHARSWLQRHGPASQENPRRCDFCHDRQAFCRTCHGLELPHPAKFRGTHGATAAAQSELCARCHGPRDCRRCHENSPPPNHTTAQWPSTHGAKGQKDPGLCVLCHGTNSCQSCHGVTMPHPDDWTLSGHGGAATSNPNVCGRCHPTTFCNQCHVPEGKARR